MAGLRARSVSSPQRPVPNEPHSYPDQAKATSNALSAATFAHLPSTRPQGAPLGHAGAVPYTTMGRTMYTSHPPVKIEVDEQRRADILHASAVAMAKRMYTQQQRMIDSARRTHHARSSSFSRHGEAASNEEAVQPMRFDNLQEAAYRLAQERLAKLHEEHQKNREFQEYYGSPASTTARRSKFGTFQRKLTRRRSASDGDLFSPTAADDEKTSQRIRQQMSLFNTKLSQVDEQKRARDREALIAAAQRNVKAQLQSIDKRVFEETGKVAPSMQGSWDQRVQQAAVLRIAASRDPNKGKVDIGGGKFMDTKAIDEIAAKKVQPLLDEINEKAEVERERQIAQRMDEERRKAEIETEKQRKKEVAELNKKLKEENKEKHRLRREEIKKEERARKEQDKISKANTDRALHGEQHASAEAVEAVAEAGTGAAEEGDKTIADTQEPKNRKMSLPFLKSKENKEKEKEEPSMATPVDEPAASPSSSNKMKVWIRNKLNRPRAKSSGAVTEPSCDEKKGGGGGGFIGGVTLARLKLGNKNNSMPSIDNRSASMREVVMAGEAVYSNPVGGETGEGSREVASRARADDAVSESAPSIARSVSSEDEFYDAKRESVMSTPAGAMSAPPAMSSTTRDSVAKESRFTELME